MSDFIDHVWLIYNSIEYSSIIVSMTKLIENAKSESAVYQSFVTSSSSSC